MPLYPIGPESEDLVQALRNSDPLLRARAARALAACRGYLALPDLLVAARSDANGGVREAARVAIRVLLPSQDVADRVVTAQPRSAPESVDTARAEASAGTIYTFRAYVSAKHAGEEISAIDDMHAAVIGYLEVWGRESITDLDATGLAAFLAIRAIAGHIKVLSGHGSGAIMFLSYDAARKRVAEYDAVRNR